MANLTIEWKKVRPVRVIEQFTAPSGVAGIIQGVAVGMNTTTARLTKADATNATNAATKGIAISYADPSGMATTVIRKGVLNVGDAVSALAFGAKVYLSDTPGLLSDTAGTVSTVIGEVVPGFGADANLAPDKLLRVDL